LIKAGILKTPVTDRIFMHLKKIVTPCRMKHR